MSTPGSFTIVSKGTNQMVPATGPTDGGTLLYFDDEVVPAFDRVILPVGDTTFQLQLQAVFSSTVANRPTWVQVELARLRPGVVDTTGKARRAVIQPGTTTWADTFTVEEYVNAGDGAFGWTVTHNGAAPIRVEVNIYKAKNPIASIIHRLGGINEMSA